jgi:hypothetical protein
VLEQELKGVVNAGIGFEHGFRNGFSAYGAFRTDFSAAKGDVASIVALSDWDVYHVSAGGSFHVGSTQFTLGATYSAGSKERSRATPISADQVPGIELQTPIDVSYKRIVVLLGFLFGS